MKKWVMASLLGLGSLVFLGGCLHLFIDADEKEIKGLYLYATGTTAGNINGGNRAGVDSFCASHKPSALGCKGGLHALINVSEVDTVANFPAAYPSLPQDLPVQNPDKTQKIADNWADLWDGSIDVSLADAGIVTGDYWTGADGDSTCQNWTGVSSGAFGKSTLADTSWWNYNANGPASCIAATYHVLCLCWD